MFTPNYTAQQKWETLLEIDLHCLDGDELAIFAERIIQLVRQHGAASLMGEIEYEGTDFSVTRQRMETLPEIEARVAREQLNWENSRERRYQQYLTLKQEFEDKAKP